MAAGLGSCHPQGTSGLFLGFRVQPGPSLAYVWSNIWNIIQIVQHWLYWILLFFTLFRGPELWELLFLILSGLYFPFLVLCSMRLCSCYSINSLSFHCNLVDITLTVLISLWAICSLERAVNIGFLSKRLNKWMLSAASLSSTSHNPIYKHFCLSQNSSSLRQKVSFINGSMSHHSAFLELQFFTWELLKYLKEVIMNS